MQASEPLAGSSYMPGGYAIGGTAAPRAHPLAEKVVLVTGGGSGIGRASALAFARAGAQVVVADVDAAGEETARLVAGAGGEAQEAIDAFHAKSSLAGVRVSITTSHYRVVALSTRTSSRSPVMRPTAPSSPDSGLDRLFRRSGLNRDKWREKTTASARSIVRCNGMRSTSPRRRSTPKSAIGRANNRLLAVLAVPGQKQKTHAQPWPEMAPLPVILPPAPPMPEAMVPDAFRILGFWMTPDVTRLPMEMIAAPVLVAAGSVVGRAVGIRPWDYDDFTVVPTLWGAVVARPGWMKTTAVKEAFRPLGQLAAAAHDDLCRRWE